MASPKKNLYEILKVAPDADALAVGLAYRQRNAELQRTVPQDPGARSLLHEAHEVLSHPQRRAAYDASLVTAAEKAEAAEQAQSPDIVLEGGELESKPKRKLVVPLVAGIVILLALLAALRAGRSPDVPSTPAALLAEAPKPPPPPPASKPKPLGPEQILPAALLSVGRLMSYEMSGRAVPVGLAVAVEPGTMITTCHAIPGGSQLVVRVGAESHSANLTVTDEVLDLCKVAVAGLVARPLAIAPDEVKPGDRIFALGANAAGEFALTEGKVKSLLFSPQGKLIEVSMPIGANGSGGAVFDTFGRLIGIATTPHQYGAVMQIALPVSWIAEMRTRTRPVTGAS